MTEVIIGNKVRLRPIGDFDTDNIVKWRNNPLVKKNFIYQKDITAEEHRIWLNSKVSSGEVIQYIIEEIKTKKTIGSVYFRDVNMDYRSAEYGIFIGEDSARGKGLGSETAYLFTEFGFKNLGLHRISLRVLSENSCARKSYEKAGFHVEGIFHDMVFINGIYHDVIFMAKFESEN